MSERRHIIVLLKQVAAAVRLTADNRLDRAAAAQGFNPDDGAALETALALHDCRRAVVTALTMGPPAAAAVLRDALARGADDAVLLTDPLLSGSDSLCTARALACAVRVIDPEALILCGRRSADGDTGQVPPMVAGFLQSDFTPDLTEVSPALSGVAAVARAAFLRQPRITGLRRAAQSPIRTLTAADCGLSAADCGLSASPTRILKTTVTERPVKTPRVLSAADLFSLLPTAAVTSLAPAPTAAVTSPASAFCGRCLVVDKPVPAAYTRGYSVSIRPLTRDSIRTQAIALAQVIRENPPDLVLASSDSPGRFLLPYAAALCRLGMTADCTALRHTDAGLLQLRPAFGGKLQAEILSRTTPVMATVRAAVTTKMMLSAGRGIGSAENFRRLCRLAEQLGAAVGASRGAVDAGYAPYRYQIGQSGKSADAAIYVAFGISGAEQHLAGLKTTGKIYAVNRDRLAPIRLFAEAVTEADAAETLTLWEALAAASPRVPKNPS